MSSDPFATVVRDEASSSPEDREVNHLREILHHLTELEGISPEAKMRVMAFVWSLHSTPKVRRGRPPKS